MENFGNEPSFNTDLFIATFKIIVASVNKISAAKSVTLGRLSRLSMSPCGF